MNFWTMHRLAQRIDELDKDFISIVACPSCKGNLTRGANGDLVCFDCDNCFPQIDRIWRFMLPPQHARYQSFLDAYHIIRNGDGWERQDDAYYLNLPNVAPDDPQASVWMTRKRTFGILQGHLALNSHSWAIDLGAGNCWLSYHLAQAGYNVLALDCNAEGRDGLSGGDVYLNQGNYFFLRGQASIDCLPIHNERIALCVISGALHYVNVQETLAQVFRVLKPQGQLIIMDSPVFEDAASGRQMRREQLAYFDLQYNVAEVYTEGTGYLVLDEMLKALSQAGFTSRVRWPNRPGSRQVRKVVNHLTGHRQTASFPLFVSTKAG